MQIEQIIYWGIIGLCLAIMLVELWKKGKEAFANILLRVICGVIGILCLNGIIAAAGGGTVGVNLFNLSVLGGLGIPGFALLYLLTAFLK